MIRIQDGDFNIGEEIEALRIDEAGKLRNEIGAIVTFTGTVRDTLAEGAGEISTLTLEHYPGMTEKMLTRIEQEANSRWPLHGSLIVHRVGRLDPGDNIVLVVCAAAHREDALQACSFLIDWLKTKAPFWKSEQTAKGEKWVKAKESDDALAARWEEG